MVVLVGWGVMSTIMDVVKGFGCTPSPLAVPFAQLLRGVKFSSNSVGGHGGVLFESEPSGKPLVQHHVNFYVGGSFFRYRLVRSW